MPAFLTATEEHELIVKGQAGDDHARNCVIENIIPFLFKIAIQVARTKGGEPEELVNVAVIKIIERFNSFDPELGTRFATYFARAARRIMLTWRRSNFLMRIPPAAWRSEATRQHAIRAMKTVSLSTSLPGGELSSMITDVNAEVFSEDADFDYIEAGEILRKSIKCLPVERREVFEMRYEGKTYEDIGKDLGCTKQNAYILHQRAVNDLMEMATQPSQPSP